MATFGSSYYNARRCILWQGSPIFKDWGCHLLHSATIDLHLCPNDLSLLNQHTCLATDLHDELKITEIGSILCPLVPAATPPKGTSTVLSNVQD